MAATRSVRTINSHECKPVEVDKGNKRKSFELLEEKSIDNDENLPPENKITKPVVDYAENPLQSLKKTRTISGNRTSTIEPQNQSECLTVKSGVQKNQHRSRIAKSTHETIKTEGISIAKSPSPMRSPGMFSIFKGTSPTISEKSKSAEFMNTAASVAQNMSNIITNSSNCLRHPTIRKMRKSLGKIPNSERIKLYFDNAFSLNEEKINELILSRMKLKNKWDYKEKSVKQSAAISDLKAAFKTIFDETKCLKENCLAVEKTMNETLLNYHHEIQEGSQLKSILKTTESQLKRDFVKLTNDLSRANTALTQTQANEVMLREAIKDSTGEIVRLKERLVAEETARSRVDAELAWLRNELSETKKNAIEASTLLVVQCDQRVETAVAGYKDEVMSLRSELKRRQTDIDRNSIEKADIDRASAQNYEKLLKTQSDLRQYESNCERLQADINKLNTELDAIKAQSIQKDSDLRASLASLLEIQRQAVAEKGLLRTEISELQNRYNLIDEEKAQLASVLASFKEENELIRRNLNQASESCRDLKSQLLQVESDSMSCKDAILQLEIEKELRVRSEMREEAERRERIAACAQLLATQTDCQNRIKEAEIKQSEENTLLRNEMEKEKKLREQAEIESRRQCDIITGLQSEMRELKRSLEHAEASHESAEQLGRVTGELEVLRRRLKETQDLKSIDDHALMDRIQSLEKQLRDGETQRRKMHNLIQELRGNIRVFARVRPFLPNDHCDPKSSVVNVKSDGTGLRIVRAASGDQKAEDHPFSFDKVFGPSSSQDAVFEEVSEFVQSALDGFNVCLFSYGQTGSGKTHTMQGSGGGPMRGIIPRAMQQVGKYKMELERKGWEYHMEVSYIEIYNETIRDLLRSTNQGNVADDTKHEIKKDAQGNTVVTDVSLFPLDPNDSSQVESILESAARHRSVAQTSMNERSSRSHSVFALHLSASNAQQGVQLRGTLSLVDLAGSERLERSGATGDRLKETQAINKSLSAMTDVFVAIANKQSHIPFRNSKLTYLLQSALSGDGKTLMMVNVSPTEESYFESLCSLRFASQVNQCELGKPKRHMKETPAQSLSISSTPSTCSSPQDKDSLQPRSQLSTCSTKSSSSKTRKPQLVKSLK